MKVASLELEAKISGKVVVSEEVTCALGAAV